MVGPDDLTFAYLHGRPYAPKGADWDAALAHWGSLPSDGDAQFDREVHLDAAQIAPMVTWGTSPEATAPITERVPDPAGVPDATRRDSLTPKPFCAYPRIVSQRRKDPPTACLAHLLSDRNTQGSISRSRLSASGTVRGPSPGSKRSGASCLT
jgi:homoaconitase/3-isopropylmalate dehydratase large subunit